MCRVRLPHNEKLLLASEKETFNSLNKSREERTERLEGKKTREEREKFFLDN